ncbi:MAG: hypothetical protein DCC64_10980 [Planctomycetota bacterium]|nr:MAG: hypothetical protein DCC64_10980 [Planctomycetota bacterium]
MELPDPRKVDWPLPPSTEEGMEPMGGEALQLAAEEIRRALRGVGSGAAEALVDMLARALEASPSPEDSVRAIERLVATPESASEFVQLSLQLPEAFSRLFVLLGHSRPLANHLVRGGWREFMGLSVEELAQPVTKEQIINRGRERLAQGVEVLAALRLTHRDFATRVLYHERALQFPLEAVTAEISALADGALQVACEYAKGEIAQRRALPAGGDFRFCVIAFGKLGARELNYASDIDLSFVFDGEPAQPQEGRGLTGQEFAVKIAEAMIPLIDQVTEDGNVFRVDTRLRPDGKKGRLARGLESTVQYYFSFGSTLERQALLKARPCAGDLELGEAMFARLTPWIYRKYLTVGEINEIKGLKRQIEQRAEAGQDTFRDLKHGFGGIRDIEFVTQFLQLLNGGRLPALRVQDTLGALKALAQNGVLKRAEADELAQAYRFLRGIEHRLQLWEGLQTYRVPESRTDIERVARCLGYAPQQTADLEARRAAGQSRAVLSPGRAMINDLKAHTLRVRGLLVRLFAGLFSTQHAPAESELVLDPDPNEEEARRLLARYGFKDPALALRLIRELAEETPENRLFGPRARKYLASMMPALLDFTGKTPDPDFTLMNFERITGRLGAKTMLFELVAEDPRALAVFGNIAAQSRWLSDILCRRPGLVDEFIDNLQTFTRLDQERLRAELSARVLASADVLDALYWQRDVELLRIGLFDISERTPLPETLRELCVVAEVVLEAALEQALREEGRREALPGAALGGALCVLGMGKLGSRALNYASDLDLVFIYDTAGLEPSKAALAQSFFTRVARRASDMLSSASERGALYRVDLRLRPHGGKSSLAVGVEEFERYLAEQAQFWERLACTRARVLFGPSTPLALRVTRALEAFAHPLAVADAAALTREMRERVMAHAPRGDLKRAAGGLHDVEFVIEFLQLAHGARRPVLRQPGMFEAIEACRAERLISVADHDSLLGAYAFLRQIMNRMQLLDGEPHDALPEGEEAELFARRAGFAPGGGLSALEQLRQELEYHKSNARAAFNKYVR